MIAALPAAVSGCRLGQLLGSPDGPGNPALGGAVRLGFLVQPAAATADDPITPPVQVAAYDAAGGIVATYTGSFTLALEHNAAGAGLEGAVTRPAVEGVATFEGVHVVRAGSGFRMVARADGLTEAVSAPFDVEPGAPAAITPVSGGGQADTVDAPVAEPYVARVTDAHGNPVEGVPVLWTASGGGRLSPGTSITDAAGEAEATLTLGSTLGAQDVIARAAGVSGGATFAVTVRHGNPARLVFTRQPTHVIVGTVIPPVEVTVFDRHGNVGVSYTGVVDVSITPGTGRGGAQLRGTLSRVPKGGVARFDDMTIDRTGIAYRLRTRTLDLITDSAIFHVVSP